METVRNEKPFLFHHAVAGAKVESFRLGDKVVYKNMLTENVKLLVSGEISILASPAKRGAGDFRFSPPLVFAIESALFNRPSLLNYTVISEKAEVITFNRDLFVDAFGDAIKLKLDKNISLLKYTSLFKDWDNAELSVLADFIQMETIRIGEHSCKEVSTNTLNWVTKGRVELKRSNSSLCLLDRGGFFEQDPKLFKECNIKILSTGAKTKICYIHQEIVIELATQWNHIKKLNYELLGVSKLRQSRMSKIKENGHTLIRGLNSNDCKF